MSAAVVPPDEKWEVWGEAIPVNSEGRECWQATVRQGQAAVCVVGGATKEIAEKNAFVVAACWELYTALAMATDGFGNWQLMHSALEKANP